MPMSEHKSKTIAETLRSEICNGKFSKDKNFPSERALVRRFQVARGTVRAALKELELLHLVRREVGSGTRVVQPRSRRAFAVIVPDIFYSFYKRIVRGIERSLEARLGSGGFSFFVAALDDDPQVDSRVRIERVRDFATMCTREKVSGVFFQPFQFLRDSEKINRSILQILKEGNIPVVLLDSDFIRPPARSEYDLAGIDNVFAGWQLATHVIEQGAKRVCYFSNPLPAPTSLKRADGVAIAVTEAELSWRRENIFFESPSNQRVLRSLFSGKNRPDAIVVVNDHVASILLKTLASIGLSVPSDVLLCSVNGDPVSEESTPQITTIVQPCGRIGECAVDLMLRRIANPSLPVQEFLLAPRLEVRASTCPPSSSLKKRTKKSKNQK